MLLHKFISYSLFQSISCIFLLAYFFGLFNIHFSDRNDYCEMTYMFEYPQFVRITLPNRRDYPQYGLFAYSEGRLTERARNMWFDGIPVLYLPGNSGSHMQARSLASIALRKAISQPYDFHFDFFTVSYNEELSGFYGGVLQRQIEFAALSIKRILSLYKSHAYKKHIPNSVIVIGHSLGGVIAKRLLAYPDTFNTTKIAIALASPLEAPIVNFDLLMNDFYVQMNREWSSYNSNYTMLKENKLLLSFGSGFRDVLVPSSVTGSEHSDIHVLTTSVPGVWVSPDHVSIVWCKQIVKAINRFLFSIVDVKTEQIVHSKPFIISKARHYFEANRTVSLNPNMQHQNVTMTANAFWYEDNRNIYQISRPEIDKLTYLMIRLVKYPHNRFVAIEAINLDDKDWLFGCNAKFSHINYRYCQTATSLSELSRWTGVAANYGKRKLGTIDLHNLMKLNPDWTHVIVKVSPTRKPVTLNIDINDHASRHITVTLPSVLSFGQSVIIEETEPSALYYELLLPEMYLTYHTYLLYIEPTSYCKASQYHVSAEVHVPWAKNHEYYHYFTQSKRSPMKLRLHKSIPKGMNNVETKEYIKITVLLDLQCRFTISIASSWYYQLAQMARNYSPLLFPYAAAIVLLAVRSNIINIKKNGDCISIHGALSSDNVKPYYVLVFTRLGTMMLTSIPLLAYIFETAGGKNSELQYFTRSLLIIPIYMSALGLLNIVALIIVVAMICSSQLAHRLFFRIIWRGGSNVAEKVASGLQKIPTVVSVALLCATPLSCGAASLITGAAFYAFMLSKMYEEYLEDYFYKLASKIIVRIACFFKRRKSKAPSEADQKPKDSTDNGETIKLNKVGVAVGVVKDTVNAVNLTASNETSNSDESNEVESVDVINTAKSKTDEIGTEEIKPLISSNESKGIEEEDKSKTTREDSGCRDDSNNDLNALNFHMMMFFLWLIVTIANMPALLTWARNFKYSGVLIPDTSYYPGIIMSLCAGLIWQIEAPRKNLKHYELLSQSLFVMAVCILILAPFAIYYVNFIVTCAFVLITVQQLFDCEEVVVATNVEQDSSPDLETDSGAQKESEIPKDETQNTDAGQSDAPATEEVIDPCEPCSENKIYRIFRGFKEKFTLNDNI